MIAVNVWRTGAVGSSLANMAARNPSRIASGPVQVPDTGSSPRSHQVASGVKLARRVSTSPFCNAVT